MSVMVVLAMSSVLMTEQYNLNMVSLNRNTYKKNKIMYWSIDENIVITDLQEPNPVFPLGGMNLLIY